VSDTYTPNSQTLAEIESQPHCWQQAIDLVREGAVSLPAVGESVLVLGCGTSYYAGQAYAWLREAAGHGPTDVMVASELPPRIRPYDRILAISRSGTSSELLDAVRQLQRTPMTAALGAQGTPLANLAMNVIDLSFADEHSVVQTRFPTTFLTMVRAFIAGADDPAVTALPAAAGAALTAPLPTTDIRQLVILGHDWSTSVAEEAALKVRESAGAWAESYPVGEYRHGPISAAGPDTLVWGITPLSDDLVQAVAATGAAVEQGGPEPLYELVRLHRYAVALAELGGRNADQPAHLSRSVVLAWTNRHAGLIG